MGTEFWVISILVVLSVAGVFWPKISNVFSFKGIDKHNPDKFQRRMDLINELLDECDGCDAETAAVIEAGDVIAKHWRELEEEAHKREVVSK